MSGDVRRAGRVAKLAERAARAAKYRTGEVVQIPDSSHARVDIGTKVVPVVVPGSLSPSLLVGQQVQVRILRNDYTLTAILTDSNGALTDGAGNVVARIAGTGSAALGTTAVDALTVGGKDIMETIDEGPRGITARTQWESSGSAIGATETGYLELRALLEPERLYKIRVEPHWMNASAAGVRMEHRLRIAYDGDTVSTSSTQIGRQAWAYSTAAGEGFGGMTATIDTHGQAADLREVRILYSTIRVSASGTATIQAAASYPVRMELEDQGPYVAPSTTAVKYTSTWECSQARSYSHASGGSIVDGGDKSSSFITGSASNYFAELLFTSNAVAGETSKTVAAALSGATVTKAEVYLRADNSTNLFPDAGYPMHEKVRAHALTAPSAVDPSGTAVTVAVDNVPVGVWADITSIFTAASRGVTVGSVPTTLLKSADADSQFQMWWGGPTGDYPPKLRLTYER